MTNRWIGRTAAWLGVAAVLAGGALTACGGQSAPGPTSTTPATTSETPLPSPTEKGIITTGGNSFSPQVKAPPAPAGVPGTNHTG